MCCVFLTSPGSPAEKRSHLFLLDAHSYFDGMINRQLSVKKFFEWEEFSFVAHHSAPSHIDFSADEL